jgi:hypothetical protein
MPLKIKYLRKILNELRYCPLPKLIDRRIEICSVGTVEADIFAILGGDLPNESQLISPEKKYIEIAMAKYGIIDVQLSVSSKHLTECPIVEGQTLRELGFVLSQEDKDSIAQNIIETSEEDVGFLDSLAEDVEKNEAFIKLFLKLVEKQSSGLGLKLPQDYFPQIFEVEDACLTNSSYVWLNKHFYL